MSVSRQFFSPFCISLVSYVVRFGFHSFVCSVFLSFCMSLVVYLVRGLFPLRVLSLVMYVFVSCVISLVSYYVVAFIQCIYLVMYLCRSLFL